MTGRICEREGCANTLPSRAATQRKFCSVRCQVAEWRRANKERSAERKNES